MTMQAFERSALSLFVVLAGAVPVVTRDEYVLHLGILVLLFVTLSTSLNLIVGYVGEFPLGHTAFLGLGAYTAALLSTVLGLGMAFTVPAGGILGALAGLAIGAITLRLRGPFFVIVTLCFAEILRLVANNWVGLTNGPMGISGIPRPMFAPGAPPQTQKLYLYVVALGIAAASLYAAFRYVHSNIGRAAVAIRENRYVAQSIGIDPYRHALKTFVIAAFMAGTAGAFYAHYISFVGPEVFGFSFMISMIIMVLLGGKGTLVGPVVGAVIVVILEEYLRDLKELRLSVFGLLVMAIVVFAPLGLLGLIAAPRTDGRSS